MYSIGVFATPHSLQNIMNIDKEMRAQCNITYLPYTSPDHLKFIYQQNMEQFDAFLFGGSYPYEVICSIFGPVKKPCAYFNISDRDYYKLIASLAVQEPQTDFRRVYFDIPDTPVDFFSIFREKDVPFLGEAPIDWDNLDPYDWYQPLKEYYLQLWNSGNVDLLIIRFGSLDEFLDQHQIRHIYLAPSSESMLEIFHGLMMQLNTAAMRDSAACLGMVRSHTALTETQWGELRTGLQICNQQYNIPFLIYEHGDHFEITTNISVLKELSRQYTTCPVTAFLKGRLEFPVCVAWGCASNVIDAHRNAQRAMQEALLCKGSAAFIVLEDNVVIGPLPSSHCLTYTDVPSHRIAQLSGQLAVSPSYLSKLVSFLCQNGKDTISAKELAVCLNVTQRSALRILSKLEAGGIAEVQYSRQLSGRGRPTKIFKIDLPKLLQPGEDTALHFQLLQ